MNVLNQLARKEGEVGASIKFFDLSKHYFPSFALFDNVNYMGVDMGKATINTISNAYGEFFWVQIPMFMIHSVLHSSISSIKLTDRQQEAVMDANEGINKFYNSNKVK